MTEPIANSDMPPLSGTIVTHDSKQKSDPRLPSAINTTPGPTKPRILLWWSISLTYFLNVLLQAHQFFLELGVSEPIAWALSIILAFFVGIVNLLLYKSPALKPIEIKHTLYLLWFIWVSCAGSYFYAAFKTILPTSSPQWVDSILAWLFWGCFSIPEYNLMNPIENIRYIKTGSFSLCYKTGSFSLCYFLMNILMLSFAATFYYILMTPAKTFLGAALFLDNFLNDAPLWIEILLISALTFPLFIALISATLKTIDGLNNINQTPATKSESQEALLDEGQHKSFKKKKYFAIGTVIMTIVASVGTFFVTHPDDPGPFYTSAQKLGINKDYAYIINFVVSAIMTSFFNLQAIQENMNNIVDSGWYHFLSGTTNDASLGAVQNV